VRVAMGLLWGQVNTGVMCPVIMTFAAVPALQRYGGATGAGWIERLTTPDYDRGALAGQAFTERQAGSDLRRTTTRAEPAGDGVYELWGHKWFCSAPMCDVFLTLAQTDPGLTCFLVERGPGFQIVRLKDKLGTRALPSAEIEFRGARAWLVGEEGAGFAPLMANLAHARLGPAGAPELRAALIRAIHHCRGRSAFGRPLVEQPAMTNVLADLALDSEAATTTSLFLAAAYESFDSPLRRLLTTVMEYWGCERLVSSIAEAMQCLGGNGYSEDSEMPRLLRDSAVHAIWEGSGNVVALDVLRAMAKEPDSVAALIEECERARGADRDLDAHLDATKRSLAEIARSEQPQFLARRVAEQLALSVQASLLVRHAPALIADAYCASRLGPARGRTYGTLPAGIDAGAIVDRALPA
jgi:putative acyl-CoA dehydrogenase